LFVKFSNTSYNYIKRNIHFQNVALHFCFTWNKKNPDKLGKVCPASDGFDLFRKNCRENNSCKQI